MDSQEIGATGGCPPTTWARWQPVSRPGPAMPPAESSGRSPTRATLVPPGCGSPTANRPTPNGKQYQGPAISPTKNAQTTSMMINRTTKLPCPVWESREEKLSRLPRGAIRWSTIASDSGKASEPSARNAPGPPIIVPNKNGRLGTRAIRSRVVLSLSWSSNRPAVARPWSSGDSSRSSSDGAQTGPGPADDTEQPFRLPGDLHQPERTIEQKRRHDASPDQVQPPQPIGKMRDDPEDPQTTGRPDQPAQGRGPIERRRRADLGRLATRPSNRRPAPAPARVRNCRSAAPSGEIRCASRGGNGTSCKIPPPKPGAPARSADSSRTASAP